MDSESSPGRYFEALYQIVLRVSSSLELDQVLAYVTEETAKALGAMAASVRLLDETKTRLEMKAVYGLSEEYLNKGPVEIARSKVDREILAGNATQIQNVAHDTSFQYPEAAQREGIVSIASVPLNARQGPIGVLRVYNNHPRLYADGSTHFLIAVGDLAGLAIENARLYDQVRQDYTATMETLWGLEPA